MFSSPVLFIALILIVLLSLAQLFMAFLNRFLLLPLLVSLLVLAMVFITKTFVQSTVVIPFLNLFLGFALGTLIIMMFVAGKSVKIMQQKFVALIDFQLINFIFAWVFLIFSILLINNK